LKLLLKYWLPAILWIALINVMSIGLFSAQDTGMVAFWIFAHLGVPHEYWQTLHFLSRKLGHITEYSILSGTVFWSLRGTTLPAVRGAWHIHWARTAWLICTLIAIVDEIHQRFVPSRTPSVHDVLLDSAAAAAVQIVLWLVLRHRPRSPEANGAVRAEAPTSA
jgi:VanZ family protein